MRSKEEAHDYRYFPDPDLLPLELTQAYVADLKKDLPELPDAKKTRFMQGEDGRGLGLNANVASVLVAEKAAADYFEATLAKFAPFPLGKPRTAWEVAKWVVGELFGRLNKAGLEIGQSPVSPDQMAELLSMVWNKTISGTIGKQVLDHVFSNGGNPKDIVAALGLQQVTDTGAIEAAVDAVIAANPDKAATAQAKPAMLGWFVGQVMKSTGGKANPQAVNELLRRKLGI
jgi:aspartyl-tRNA(Asn)/glutamyl-tRNA(Gln) amidotransferase subunit B